MNSPRRFPAKTGKQGERQGREKSEKSLQGLSVPTVFPPLGYETSHGPARGHVRRKKTYVSSQNLLRDWWWVLFP